MIKSIVLNSLDQLPADVKVEKVNLPFVFLRQTLSLNIEVVVNPMLPPDLILMMDDHGNIGVLQSGKPEVK